MRTHPRSASLARALTTLLLAIALFVAVGAPICGILLFAAMRSCGHELRGFGAGYTLCTLAELHAWWPTLGAWLAGLAVALFVGACFVARGERAASQVSRDAGDA